MKYSEYLQQNRGTFWSSPQAKYINSKRAGKSLAIELGIPVPRTFPMLPDNVMIKPDNGHSGKLCRSFLKAEDWICEERIVHDHEFRLFVFGRKVVMLQIDKSSEQPDGVKIIGQSYYKYPVWERLDIDSNLRKIPSLNIDVEPPICLPTMVDHSLRLAERFTLPLRVDWFVNPEGKPVFNEMCVTPGLVVAGRITEAGDTWLGSFLAV